MKRIRFQVEQLAEKVDRQGLSSAIELAQAKLMQLGADDFNRCKLAFEVSTTAIDITVETVEDDDGYVV